MLSLCDYDKNRDLRHQFAFQGLDNQLSPLPLAARLARKPSRLPHLHGESLPAPRGLGGAAGRSRWRSTSPSWKTWSARAPGDGKRIEVRGCHLSWLGMVNSALGRWEDASTRPGSQLSPYPPPALPASALGGGGERREERAGRSGKKWDLLQRPKISAFGGICT